MHHTRTELTVSAPTLRAMLEAAIITADAPKSSLPVLSGIVLRGDGAGLTVFSTDRYHVSWAQAGVTRASNFLTWISVDDAKALAKELPKIGPSVVAIDEFGARAIEVTINGASAGVYRQDPEEAAEFPLVEKLLGGFEPGPAEVEALFISPVYLAKMAKLPRKKNEAVALEVDRRGASKSIRSRWEFEGARFTYMVMPMRGRLVDWSA